MGMQIFLMSDMMPTSSKALIPLSLNARLIDLPAAIFSLRMSPLRSKTFTLYPRLHKMIASNEPTRPAPIIVILFFKFSLKILFN